MSDDALAMASSSTVAGNDTAIEKAKARLMKLGLVTCRGERATAQDKTEMRKLVEELTNKRDTTEMRQLSSEGSWDLIMSDTQLFRSSPFFMAARAVVSDGQQADQFNWFCDQHRAALDFSQIGRVRQVVEKGQLRSEFEVKVGLATVALGLPVSVTGWIVTTADIIGKDEKSNTPSADEGEAALLQGCVDMWQLAVKSVQVLSLPCLPASDACREASGSETKRAVALRGREKT